MGSVANCCDNAMCERIGERRNLACRGASEGRLSSRNKSTIQLRPHAPGPRQGMRGLVEEGPGELLEFDRIQDHQVTVINPNDPSLGPLAQLLVDAFARRAHQVTPLFLG